MCLYRSATLTYCPPANQDREKQKSFVQSGVNNQYKFLSLPFHNKVQLCPLPFQNNNNKENKRETNSPTQLFAGSKTNPHIFSSCVQLNATLGMHSGNDDASRTKPGGGYTLLFPALACPVADLSITFHSLSHTQLHIIHNHRLCCTCSFPLCQSTLIIVQRLSLARRQKSYKMKTLLMYTAVHVSFNPSIIDPWWLQTHVQIAVLCFPQLFLAQQLTDKTYLHNFVFLEMNLPDIKSLKVFYRVLGYWNVYIRTFMWEAVENSDWACLYMGGGVRAGFLFRIPKRTKFLQTSMKLSTFFA